MKDSSCRHEQAVLKCLKTSNWDDDTHFHFKSCAICQEHATVWKWMLEFSEETLKEAPKKEYGLVWLKSRFMQQQAAQKKALRPLMIFQSMAGILMGLTALIWSIWNQSQLAGWFKNLTAVENTHAINFDMTNLSLILPVFLGLLLSITAFSLASNSFVQEE